MNDASVVIIGGGVMGVSLLFHLTEAGWRDVVLLEKNDLTHGSTWHAAGLCTHFAHNATIQELRAHSVRLYRDELPARTGDTCGFHTSGAMRITRNPDRMDEFRHVAGLSKFTGYELEVLTPQRIAELHPLATLDGLLGGIYEPDDGHVDPTLATNAMAKLALANGATIKRYEPVRGMHRETDHWIVETEKSSYRSTHVVNAAGTWAWEVGQMMGLNLPVVPMLHQYLVTETAAAISERQSHGLPELPIIRDPEESWYVRQERDGLILGPYERDATAWSIDGVPPEFGAELLPADLDRIEHIIQSALKRIPALGESGIKTVVNGPITYTPDANPLIGPAHGIDNAWLITGSSMGIMEGGGAGWFLAHWMTHKAPPMDAQAVDSRRFGEWADRDFRVDKAIESFGLQFGVHYPYEERPAGRNMRISPLHREMLACGAVMGCVNGWERPLYFASTAPSNTLTFNRPEWFDAVANEVQTVTQHAAIADLSVFSKFRISGKQTFEFIDSLGANSVPSVGRAGLTHVLTPAGGVASEFSVAMVSDTEARLTSGAATERIDLWQLQSHAASFDVKIENVTADYAAIGLMGPKATEILTLASSADDTADFDWLSCRQITVGGVPALAIRLSYVGESGWEFHVANAHALALYQALIDAGAGFKLGHYGAYTANSMRIEKAYPAYGTELTTERTPEESAAGRFAKTDAREFVGRQTMIERRGDTAWKTVLIEIVAKDIYPYHAHPVFNSDDKVIGVVTSAAFGHRCQKTLGFALLREHRSFNDLSVEIMGRRYPANVLNTIPFDPANKRMKC